MGLPRLLPPALRLRRRRSPSSSCSARRSRRSWSGCRSTSAGSGSSSSCSRSSTRARSSRWSAAALHFGRIPALFSALAAARVPGVRDALPPGLERRGVRDRARGLGAAARPRAGRAVERALRRARRRHRGARAHPARRTRSCCRWRSRAARRVRRLAPPARARRRMRRSQQCSRSRRGRCTTASATTTRPSRVAGGRGCRSCRSSPRTGRSRPGTAPRRERLGELIEDEVLSQEPHAGLDVTLDAYLRNGTNYETVRLIALSDSRARARTRTTTCSSTPRSRRFASTPAPTSAASPTRSGSSCGRSRSARTSSPASRRRRKPPAPTYESDGDVLPNPQATVLVVGVPYGFVWCASDYIDSCTLADPSEVVARSGDAGALSRGRRAGAGVGRRASGSREGVSFVPEILNRITPRYPTPVLWLAVGVVALLWRRPRGWRTIVLLWLAAFLVLLIHAASQGLAPEFALPALSGVHRDRALRACRGPGADDAASIDRVSQVPSTLEERAGASTTAERRSPSRLERNRARHGHQAGAALPASRPPRALALSRAARDARAGATSSSATSRRSSASRGRSSCPSSRRPSTSSSSGASRTSRPEDMTYPSLVIAGVLPMQYFASALTVSSMSLRREPPARDEGVLPAHAAPARRRHRPARRLPRRVARAHRGHGLLRHLARRHRGPRSRRSSSGSRSSPPSGSASSSRRSTSATATCAT